MNNILQTDFHFPTCIHRTENNSFIPTITPIFDSRVQQIKNKVGVNSAYPATMTENLLEEKTLYPFFDFVLSSANQALIAQGYNTSNFNLNLQSIFGQQHEFSSGMDSHLHNSLLSGFYFLETPGDIKALFFDSRDAKVHGAVLPENSQQSLTPASNVVSYDPYPGLLLLTNSWLKHSLTRNPHRAPFKFIHIAVTVSHNFAYSEKNTPPTPNKPAIVV